MLNSNLLSFALFWSMLRLKALTTTFLQQYMCVCVCVCFCYNYQMHFICVLQWILIKEFMQLPAIWRHWFRHLIWWIEHLEIRWNSFACILFWKGLIMVSLVLVPMPMCCCLAFDYCYVLYNYLFCLFSMHSS